MASEQDVALGSRPGRVAWVERHALACFFGLTYAISWTIWLTEPLLARYGYASKQDACFLQCFELAEVKRLRGELHWAGRMVMLIADQPRGGDGTDDDRICTPEGLQELAGIVDGIGPALGRLFSWKSATELHVTELTRQAHAAKLVVHPYTVRRDALPKHCPSVDALHAALTI